MLKWFNAFQCCLLAFGVFLYYCAQLEKMQARGFVFPTGESLCIQPHIASFIVTEAATETWFLQRGSTSRACLVHFCLRCALALSVHLPCGTLFLRGLGSEISKQCIQATTYLWWVCTRRVTA